MMKLDRRKFPRKTDATFCLFTNCDECEKRHCCLIYNFKQEEEKTE